MRLELPGTRIPSTLQALAFYARPIGFVRALRRRYGPSFRLEMPPFGEIAYVSDADSIREVFTGSDDIYRAGAANFILRPILGDRSVLLLDGDEHLQQRKLMLPPFHGDAVRRYEDAVREIAAKDVARWPLREPFAVRPRLQRMTLEVILRVVIGVRDDARLRVLRELLPRLLNIKLVDIAVYAAWPGFAESKLAGRLGPMRLRRRVDEILYAEIADRRRSAGAHGDDVLSLLVAARDGDSRGLSDGELRDQIMTLLLAGHETTATSLAWTLERLVRHPRVLARLREAVDAGDSDEYLDAVCKESLRVRPVIMDVARRVTRDVDLPGGRVRAGAMVMPAIALAHLDSGTYEDPDEFRPERFLGVRPGTYTWLPFGGGTRRCVGAAFALMEMKSVLRTMVERVDLATTHAPGEGARVKHVTIVPARGGRIAVAARRRATDAPRLSHADSNGASVATIR